MTYVCCFCTVGRRIQRAVKRTLQHARAKPTLTASSADISLEDLEHLVASLSASAVATARGDDCIAVIDTRTFCERVVGDTRVARADPDDTYYRVPVMFVSKVFVVFVFNLK